MRAGTEDLSVLEARMGYRFTQRALLSEALTHPSYARVGVGALSGIHNQRLEFLGDAVLGAVLAEALFKAFPQEREGVLTRNRSTLVQRSVLAQCGRRLGLESFLLMAEPDLRAGHHLQDAALEDAIEALIGAVYLDGGMEAAKAFVSSLYGDLTLCLAQYVVEHNPKGRLQEWMQRDPNRGLPDYRLVESSGPDHGKTFVVEVWIRGQCEGRGLGASKKEAEERAAAEALRSLGI